MRFKSFLLKEQASTSFSFKDETDAKDFSKRYRSGHLGTKKDDNGHHVSMDTNRYPKDLLKMVAKKYKSFNEDAIQTPDNFPTDFPLAK